MSPCCCRCSSEDRSRLSCGDDDECSVNKDEGDDDDVPRPMFRPPWVRAGPGDCQFLDQISPLESATGPSEMGEWLKVSPSHLVSHLAELTVVSMKLTSDTLMMYVMNKVVVKC